MLIDYTHRPTKAGFLLYNIERSALRVCGMLARLSHRQAEPSSRSHKASRRATYSQLAATHVSLHFSFWRPSTHFL